MGITVRRFAAHEWPLYRELRLRALADSPDAFGSTHARESARADAEWEDRLRVGVAAETEMPVVALVDEMPVGLAWGRQDEHDVSVAHVFQVWVAPEARGKGAGSLLLNAVIAWAKGLGVRTVRLGVTASHPAAFRLYKHAGFVEDGNAEPLRPGSSILCQPMQLAL
ncbi:MAG TPA: GNAT family N-acetyltransferase [Gemmatimonadaceae bacterium]|nr:GNAT family N-acetyltransferase [Gemmatimonadaceae bacterium]